MDATARLTCNEYGLAKMKLGLQGIEVVEKDIMNASQRPKGDRVDDDKSEEVTSGSPRVVNTGGNRILNEKSNSSTRTKAGMVHSGKGLGQDIDSRNIEDDVQRDQKSEMIWKGTSSSSFSKTKTRMAQLSGNGYLEEMAKIYYNGSDSMEVEVSKCNSSSGGNNLDVPLGFEPVLGMKCDGVSNHPTLGVDNSTAVNQGRKVKDAKRLLDQTSKRVTRSQTRQSKGSIKRKLSNEIECSVGEGRMLVLLEVIQVKLQRVC